MEPPVSLSGLRILVLDDDRDCVNGVATLLRIAGAEVIIASRAAEALLVLRERQVEVVLADLGLPNHDGFAFLKALRKDETHHCGETQARVIALTGYAHKETRVRAMEAGFDLHLAKPIDAMKLILAVRMCADGQAATFESRALEVG